MIPMFKDRKNIVIGVLALGLAVCLFFLLQKSTSPPYDETLINTRINTLEQENTNLEKDIVLERIKSAKYLIKIDSLRNHIPIVEYKYIKIYEKIDSDHVSGSVAEFDSIFTANGIH